jgi:YHS domain-containing protein
MDSKSSSQLPMACGRPINGDPVYYPFAEYRGRVIFFCTEYCRNAFKADPNRFYVVHSHKSKPMQENDSLGSAVVRK